MAKENSLGDISTYGGGAANDRFVEVTNWLVWVAGAGKQAVVTRLFETETRAQKYAERLRRRFDCVLVEEVAINCEIEHGKPILYTPTVGGRFSDVSDC